MRSMPLTLFALVLYNVIVFGGGLAGQHDVVALLAQSFAIDMPSHDVWRVSLSDIFVSFTLVLLFIEVVRATRTGRGEILNHAFSTLTFVAALVELLLLRGFATSTFFLLVAMTLFDVVAGYTISIVSARRDLVLPEHE